MIIKMLKKERKKKKKPGKKSPHVSIWFIGREVNGNIFGPDPFTTTALLQLEGEKMIII